MARGPNIFKPFIPSSATITINEFASVSAVATGVLTSIVNYTVPVGKTLYLNLIEYSGENIARFDVLINATLQARRVTYFSGPLSDEFIFSSLRVPTGQTVELKIIHVRPEVGDFDGRISGLLV